MPSSETASNQRRPTLVVVSGLPATGKSKLAEQLRDELGWPLFTKDRFKELLYDVLDRRYEAITRDDSHQFGAQAIALVLDVSRELLQANVSHIIEANFLPWFAPADLAPLLERAEAKQVHCTIPDELVLTRYRQRAEEGDRHPVHVDADALHELEQRIADGGGRPLPINAELLQVDTTEGFRPGLPEIVAFCRS